MQGYCPKKKRNVNLISDKAWFSWSPGEVGKLSRVQRTDTKLSKLIHTQPPNPEKFEHLKRYMLLKVVASCLHLEEDTDSQLLSLHRIVILLAFKFQRFHDAAHRWWLTSIDFYMHNNIYNANIKVQRRISGPRKFKEDILRR